MTPKRFCHRILPMGALREVLRGFFQEDPRKKECAGLVSTFRGQIENLLDGSKSKEFFLDSEQTRQLAGHWVRPATAEIKRTKKGVRVDIWNENHGEAIKLEGKSPRFLETAGSVGRYWEKPKEGGDLGTKMLRMQEWIGYVTVLKEHQKNPQTAFSTPIAP